MPATSAMVPPLPPPLTGAPPREVPLPRSPLVRVISQAVFPTILAIQQAGTKVTEFQEAIRTDYPFFKVERVRRLVLESEGSPGIEDDVVWRFSDRTRHWHVSLGTSFIALDTDRYTSRTDFLRRLGALLAAVERSFEPQVALRLGLRYVDRLTGEALNDLGRLIRPEVVGVSNLPLGKAAQHVLTEALLPAEEGSLQARWGILPPGVTPDPNVVEASPEYSWILDIDMFSSQERSFIASELETATQGFAERVYSVFRWIVKDDFLKLYGGTL